MIKKKPAPTGPAVTSTQNDQQKRTVELAKFFANLVCDGENAPFIARRLIVNRRLAEAGPGLEDITRRLLAADATDCAGGVGLTSSDLSFLRALNKPATK